MSKFIELTYYERNKVYPDKSIGTGKKFLLSVDDISTITPYEHSTKIRFKYTGEILEVTETVKEISNVLKEKIGMWKL